MSSFFTGVWNKDQFVECKCRDISFTTALKNPNQWRISRPNGQWTLRLNPLLWCYFWIFLIMSQHNFGYINVMYSGAFVSVRLSSTTPSNLLIQRFFLLLYPNDSHYWTFSLLLHNEMHPVTWRWNFISSLGITVPTIPRCTCKCVYIFEGRLFDCYDLMTFTLRLISANVIIYSLCAPLHYNCQFQGCFFYLLLNAPIFTSFLWLCF